MLIRLFGSVFSGVRSSLYSAFFCSISFSLSVVLFCSELLTILKRHIHIWALRALWLKSFFQQLAREDWEEKKTATAKKRWNRIQFVNILNRNGTSFCFGYAQVARSNLNLLPTKNSVRTKCKWIENAKNWNRYACETVDRFVFYCLMLGFLFVCLRDDRWYATTIFNLYDGASRNGSIEMNQINERCG